MLTLRNNTFPWRLKNNIGIVYALAISTPNCACVPVGCVPTLSWSLYDIYHCLRNDKKRQCTYLLRQLKLTCLTCYMHTHALQVNTQVTIPTIQSAKPPLSIACTSSSWKYKNRFDTRIYTASDTYRQSESIIGNLECPPIRVWNEPRKRVFIANLAGAWADIGGQGWMASNDNPKAIGGSTW